MKFKDYHIAEEIKEQLAVLEYKKPTDIQYRAIPHILKGEDVMAVAQTGTGKTAAYVIPTLDHILRSKRSKKARCLVLVPTRELAKQVGEVYRTIGKTTGVKAFALFGGIEQEQQVLTLKKGVDVVIATPGRMFDLIAQGYLDVSEVKQLVLDEADLMLDLGFYKDIKDVLRHIPKKHQTLFFTATITKKIKKAAYEVVKDAIRIQISPKNPVNRNIDHAVMFVEMDDKRFFLENFIKEYSGIRLVVFVRTKVRAERVVEAMKRVGISTEALHGGIIQKDRFAILDRFRSGENHVLITTDVAARGIDIPDVDYVINYDIPEDPENYVHRCGRTGRGRKRGQALSFCSPGEKPLLEAIEEYTGDEIERYAVSKSDYRAIIEDSADDTEDDWRSLLRDVNREEGTEEEW